MLKIYKKEKVENNLVLAGKKTGFLSSGCALMRRGIPRRLLSWFLVAALLLGMSASPVAVLAEDTVQETETEETGLEPPVLKLDSVTKTSITITWEAAESASSYELYQYDAQTGQSALLATTAQTTYAVSKLQAATTLSFQIRCVDAQGVTGAMSQVYSFTTKPEQVTGLAASVQSDTSITLTWNPVEGATSYVVYRYNKTEELYEIVNESTTTTCVDDELTPATAYRYKVAAETSAEGAKSDALFTCTIPGKVGVASVKSGTKRAKVCWNKITGSSGYHVYMLGNAGEETLVGTQEGAKNTTQIVEDLEMGSKVSFVVRAYKTYRDVTYYGATSSAVSQTINGVKKTSTAPKLYKTWAKFKKSATYKKFKDFKKNLLKAKAVVLPGMVTTNVAGFNADMMCPQGICFAKKYLLVTAYDYEGYENSVIYVIKKSTGKYVTSLVLENKSHVGGIAFDGKYIWVCNGSKVSAIPYSAVTKAVKSGEDYYQVSYTATCDVQTKASYMTYHDGKLWVGEYSEYATRYVYSYSISGSGETLALAAENRITVPEKTQSLAFDKSGNLFLSRSCQIGDWLSVYLSVLEVYKPGKPDANGIIALGEAKKQRTMPPMAEGIVIQGKYLYLNFESVMFNTCKYRNDRIVAYKKSALLK